MAEPNTQTSLMMMMTKGDDNPCVADDKAIQHDDDYAQRAKWQMMLAFAAPRPRHRLAQ